MPILRKYRPDLAMTFLECPPPGLVMLTRLNPRDRTLRDNYDRIIADFLEMALDNKSIAEHLASCPLRSSEEFMQGNR